MSRQQVPAYEQREATYRAEDSERAQAVAGADALVYCPTCETSHPATRTEAGYDVDCPAQ